QLAAGVSLALTACSLFQARTTWTTPAEWAALPDMARAVQQVVPPDALMVAPEALLYSADRRGCRLGLARVAAGRAAAEWGGALETDTPLGLVEFYRLRGATFIALPGSWARRDGIDSERLALQEAIRRRYNVLVDAPFVLIAALADPQEKG